MRARGHQQPPREAHREREPDRVLEGGERQAELAGQQQAEVAPVARLGVEHPQAWERLNYVRMLAGWRPRPRAAR